MERETVNKEMKMLQKKRLPEFGEEKTQDHINVIINLYNRPRLDCQMIRSLITGPTIPARPEKSRKHALRLVKMYVALVHFPLIRS